MEICNDDDEQKTLVLNDLPDEMLTKIFSYVSLKELCCCVRVVCQRWFYLSCTEMLWSTLTAEDILKESSPSALMRFICLNTSSLKYLLLDNCEDIPTHDLKAIADLVPNLCELSLAFCSQVNKPVLQTFSEKCREITALNLEGCEEITDDCLTMFSGHHISRLNLSHCNHMTDDSLIFTSNTFQSIKYLNLDGIQWIGDDAVRILLQNCNGTLQYLWLDGERLTDFALTMLHQCQNLRTLKISFCDQLTDLTLSTIPQMEKLRSLSLRKGKNFSREEIIKMFNNLKTGLLYLDFTDSRALNDQAVLCLTQSSPDLIALDLSWCWEVTDEGLANIVCGCRRIVSLTLVGLHVLTGEPLKETVHRLPQLKYLDLRNCNSIKDNILRDIVKQCASLSAWDYYGQLLE